jgi:hypothetical protein
LHHQQPDDAAPEHGDRGARLEARHIEPVQAAADRLAERPMQRRQSRWQLDGLPDGHDDVFGKAAIELHADGLEVVAEIDPADPARRAVATGDVGVARHPRPNGDPAGAFPGRLDDAAEFVPERYRQSGGIFATEHVPVAAADAGRLDPHQQLAGAGPGHRDGLDPHVPDRPQSRCPHFRFPPFARV